MLQGLIGTSVVVTTCVSAKSIIHFKAIMVAKSSSIYLSISKMFIRFCSDGLFTMTSLGIITLFAMALATASFTSHMIVGPQQAIAKPTTAMMKSMISNMTRMGVIVTPITCITLGDVMKSLSVMFRNATAAGGNETNSTQGMMMNLMEQGMKSGMQNVSQSELQHLKDFVFCSPANEKMMRSMMK